MGGGSLFVVGIVICGWGVVICGGVLLFIGGGWSFIGGCGRLWVVICGHLCGGVVVHVWGVVVHMGSLSSVCGVRATLSNTDKATRE